MEKTADLIIQKKIDKLIFRFWNPFFLPCYIYIIKYLRKNQILKFSQFPDNASQHENFLFSEIFNEKVYKSEVDGVITMSKNVVANF